MAENENDGRQLTAFICNRMKDSPDGVLSFAEFMNDCLYHPSWGYYPSARAKIGKDGDFYTASSIGTLTGEMLAVFLQRECEIFGWSEGPVSIMEWGAGTGRLALHILNEIKASYPSFYRRLTYMLVEKSPHHRRLQQDLLAPHRDRLRWVDGEDTADGSVTRTLVLSNELLDAFCVHRVRMSSGRLQEMFVAWDETGQTFRAEWRDAENQALKKALEADGVVLTDGQLAEINLEAPRWIERMLRRMRTGTLLTIDYGDKAEELYAPHRMEGTFMCYRRHIAHDNPFVQIGGQDMTAHVNFSACMRAGDDAGAAEQRLISQRGFLLEQGLLERLQDTAAADPFGPAAKRNRAIRQLLWGSNMGELFKVLIQRKIAP